MLRLDEKSGAELTETSAAPRQVTRSPLYVFTLASGAIVALVGWTVATLFERTVVAAWIDAGEAIALLPGWLEHAPGWVDSICTLTAVLAVAVWLVARRRPRDLLLSVVAAAAGLAISVGGAELLMALSRPATRDLYESQAETTTRYLSSDPVLAGAVAVLVLVRRWISPRGRLAAYVFLALWILADFVDQDVQPYLGLSLDVGLAMVAGSAVALAVGTYDMRPDRESLVEGLAASGVAVDSIEPAAVDARGSEPWFATTSSGHRLFVKALSSEQRVADIMFRALRWLRLRRTGDAPPETSLKRSAEHEAFVSHHVRYMGVPTPRAIAVADLGDHNVALVYEGMTGRSLDHMDQAEVEDELLVDLWKQIAVLRANGIAHRDLRAANVFVTESGSPLLIDFGFAELAARPQLLDADVAELLASTTVIVGADRAVAAAAEVMSQDVLTEAREWLHPLALTTATKNALGAQGLERLRTRLEQELGLYRVEMEQFARLSLQRLVAVTLVGLGAYLTVVLVVEDDILDGVDALDWALALACLGLSVAAYPLMALALRAVSQGRYPVLPAIITIGQSRVPLAAPTYWSAAARAFAHGRGRAGLSRTAIRRAIAGWTVAALATAPVVAAGAGAAFVRDDAGYLASIGFGSAVGLALGAAEVLLLVATPWGHELFRVWLAPLRQGRGEIGYRTAGLWWLLATLAGAFAFAAAARSAGVSMDVGGLVMVGAALTAVVSLLPAPGGIGAVELIGFLALVEDSGAATAGLAVLVYRVLTFWVQIPFGLWAQWHNTRSDS